MDLVAVISPNGLGHFRRVVRQLDGLLAARPSLSLGLVCSAWQLEGTRGWGPLERVLASNPRVETEALAGAFRWVADPNAYDAERLSGWIVRLQRLEFLVQARRVLSDNLAGVLELRPDAALGASFLWSDVLEPLGSRSPAVERFVAQERQLLARHRPFLLCVADLAMPNAIRQTRAVQLPWLCEWSIERKSQGRTIGVLGGATGTASARMERITQALLECRDLEIRVDRQLKQGRFAAEPRVLPFSHDQAGYEALSLAFVRPGAGTLTDCVGGLVPMIALDEPDNPEMVHNAQAVSRLGIGAVLAGDAAALPLAREQLEPAPWKARVEALARLEKDGMLKAVDWLVNWVGA